MEAYLRLASYPIVNMSHTIYTLSVHKENSQGIIIEEGHEVDGMDMVQKNTKLTSFFQLCCEDEFARTLTYDRVPYYYW